MIEKVELVGKCPIGEIYRKTKVDRFGFWAGESFIKMVRKDWYFEQIFQDYAERGLTYSDIKYYAPKSDFKEIEVSA